MQRRRQALPSDRRFSTRGSPSGKTPSQASPPSRVSSRAGPPRTRAARWRSTPLPPHLQAARRKQSLHPHQEGVSARPGTQRGSGQVNSRRAARHAPPRQALLPREHLTLLRQLERGPPGPPLLLLPLLTPRRQPERGRLIPPPLFPPSGQGKPLLRLLALDVSRTSTSPRSAPTRKKKSKILLLYL